MQEQHNTLHSDTEDLTKQNKTTDVHFNETMPATGRIAGRLN